MFATILLILGIAGVVANVWIGWNPGPTGRHGYTGGIWKRNRWPIVTGALGTVLLLGNGSAWIVQHLTKTPVLECYSYAQIARNMPNCEIWGIQVVPKERMKSVRLIIHFDEQINESILARMAPQGEHANWGPQTEIDAPCQIASRPADRDPALTFVVSSDRHEIIIEGLNFSKYDTQGFVATFYPYSGNGITQSMDIKGEATYERLGYELKAPIRLIDPINHQSTIIPAFDEKNVHGFARFRDEFLISSDSFFLNILGIIAIVLSCAQVWHPANVNKKQELRQSKKRHVLLIASAVVAISVLLLTGSPWIETRLSPAPTVLCWWSTKYPKQFPNCAFWAISVIPMGPVKEFHLLLNLDQSVHDSIVTDGIVLPSSNFHVESDAVDGPPCNFPEKRSGRDEFLTFSFSSDNRQVIISGRNINSYDSQTLVLAFYPDSKTGRYLIGEPSGEATYEAFGHDLSARVVLGQVENGKFVTTIARP